MLNYFDAFFGTEAAMSALLSRVYSRHESECCPLGAKWESDNGDASNGTGMRRHRVQLPSCKTAGKQ